MSHAWPMTHLLPGELAHPEAGASSAIYGESRDSEGPKIPNLSAWLNAQS